MSTMSERKAEKKRLQDEAAAEQLRKQQAAEQAAEAPEQPEAPEPLEIQKRAAEMAELNRSEAERRAAAEAEAAAVPKPDKVSYTVFEPQAVEDLNFEPTADTDRKIRIVSFKEPGATFVGICTMKDAPEGLSGTIWNEFPSGEKCLISNYYAIQKAVHDEVEKDKDIDRVVFKIEYLGQRPTKKASQKVSEFKIFRADI